MVQYILSMLLIPLCFMGCMFAGMWGLSTPAYDDFSSALNPHEKQMKAISASIIVGCLGILCVNIFGLCLICTYGRYFGVLNNYGRRRGTTVVVINQANPGATVFTANNGQVSSLQEQNRLLQMQIQLQQQQLHQQQQQFPTLPPSYGTRPGYPPTMPPAYGARWSLKTLVYGDHHISYPLFRYTYWYLYGWNAFHLVCVDNI